MAFTLGTASQATGCAKSTILRAIKAGRISAVRDDLGQWQIQPVELFRIFPALALLGATPQERDATTDMLVAELRQVIADLRRGQEDLRQERDHWRATQKLRTRTPRRNGCCYPRPQRLQNGTQRRRGEAHRYLKRAATGSPAA